MEVEDRSTIRLLYIEPDAQLRHEGIAVLQSQHYGHIRELTDHGAALNRLSLQNFTHVVFSTSRTNVSASDFLAQALNYDPSVTPIPCSRNPNVDMVCDLLMLGAKGFLISPFTSETIDQVITIAAEASVLPDQILKRADRNKVLAAMMIAALDKIAEGLKYKDTGLITAEELASYMNMFRENAEMAKVFAKGGDTHLLAVLQDFMIERSKKPQTRLGKLRRELEKLRQAELEEVE